MSKKTSTEKRTPGSLHPACSAADSDGEEMPKEQEAIEAGLALVDAKWDGESDFDKGMRLLQHKLGIKR